MSILFISDDIITPFKFWHNGHLATGMHFREELWGQVLVAPDRERQRFFQTIEALSAQDADVMITASRHSYKGWVNLRSARANSLLPQPAALAPPTDLSRPTLPESAPLQFLVRETLFNRPLALQAA